MKRLLTLILVGVLLLCMLAGCGDDGTTASSSGLSESSTPSQEMSADSEPIADEPEDSSMITDEGGQEDMTTTQAPNGDNSTTQTGKITTTENGKTSTTKNGKTTTARNGKVTTTTTKNFTTTKNGKVTTVTTKNGKVTTVTTKNSKVTTTTTTTAGSKRPAMTAAVSESPLSNTYKLLTSGDKKLTIGYIGGSITLGTSAEKDGGNLMLSWANRTTTWFKEQFPDAEITAVNAGISDTMTSLALYRLETTLMNTNGHDMPDLIFVEFTSNDWKLEIQGKDELLIQIESLFRNIWRINPAAEIVTVISSRTEGNSRSAYVEVSEHYGVPVVYAGDAMQAAMNERGPVNEVKGYYYYTTDNLHPSWRGYEIYLNETVKIFKKHLLGLNLKSNNLYAYGKHLPKPINSNLITSPSFIAPEDLTVSGNAEIKSFPVRGQMYNLSTTAVQHLPITEYSHQLFINGSATVKTSFSGSTLGVLMCPFPTGFNIRWRVDGGEWKNFKVDKNHSHSFMLYDRPIVFLLEYGLTSGNHSLEMEFLPTTEGGDLQMRLGGIAVNG